MPGYSTPKEMHHPSGSKVLLAFSSEEEGQILKDFAAYREEQHDAHMAAIEGREIRRGPGRPRKIEES